MPIYRFTHRATAATGCAAAVAALVIAGTGSLSEAGAAPSPAEPASPTPTASANSSDHRSDQRGYLDSSARCDDDQVAMVFGRTARALVAICVTEAGNLQYRGVRLTDGASVTLPAGRSSSGSVIATNDGVTYAVSPAAFLVSEGDTVLYRDPWVEFRQPRFEDIPSSSAPRTSSTPTSSAPTSSRPTVSTTTVTMAPRVSA